MPKAIPLHFGCVACQVDVNSATGSQGAIAVLIMVAEHDVNVVVKNLCFAHRRMFDSAKKANT